MSDGAKPLVIVLMGSKSDLGNDEARAGDVGALRGGERVPRAFGTPDTGADDGEMWQAPRRGVSRSLSPEPVGRRTWLGWPRRIRCCRCSGSQCRARRCRGSNSLLATVQMPPVSPSARWRSAGPAPPTRRCWRSRSWRTPSADCGRSCAVSAPSRRSGFWQKHYPIGSPAGPKWHARASPTPTACSSFGRYSNPIK